MISANLTFPSFLARVSLLFFVSFFVLCSCKKHSDGANKGFISAQENEVAVIFEKHRPRYHFTPKEKWMNDPNGLVYHKGYYHLFYQYYPDSTVWGPMHWGHAKSSDLLHWERRPIALYPDSLGYIFSGSAVIDKENTTGFGKDAMVAVYTYHDPKLEKEGSDLFQTQGIAYSLDEGETWTKYNGNPVIPNPGIRDFRDPKVFWNEDKSSWQMVLVAKDHVQIYDSKNLKEWEKISEFRFKDESPLGVWECPDLFELSVEGTDETKWVLIVSHGDGAPNSGSGTRYFIGDYDGKTFTTDQKESLWIDHGRDNYAGVTYNNTPDNTRIFIGWMSNWAYAITTPTTTWRSAMTIPRELKLYKTRGGYQLKTPVVSNFEKLLQEKGKGEIDGGSAIQLQDKHLAQCLISFEVSGKADFTAALSNVDNEAFQFGYHAATKTFYTDRSVSGKVDFNNKFVESEPQQMPIPMHELLDVEIYVDASSVAIFINDGTHVMTNQVFPNSGYNQLNIISTEGLPIKDFKIQPIKSIWDN